MVTVTSYLMGNIKRAMLFTILDFIAPFWWDWERCKRILIYVGARSVRQTYKKGIGKKGSRQRDRLIFELIVLVHKKAPRRYS